MRVAWWLLLVACREDKHSLPTVTPGSDDPLSAPTAPTVNPSTLSGGLEALFDATQSPDTAGTIAKLEAQRATMSEAERKVTDRAIAVMRAGEAAMAERDRAKSRPLQIQLLRDTMVLLDDMAALSPDDLDVITTVASSFDMMAAQIESMEVADEIPPKTVRQRGRALADRMIKVHPNAGKAWSLYAWFTPRTDPEARLRALAKCLKFEPTNANCKESFEKERKAYVEPYCEGADLKTVDLEWREVSLKPKPNTSTVEHHYETYYVTTAPKFTFKDVVRAQAGSTIHETHGGGKVEREMISTVEFELAPGKLDAMIAWSRELERREDGYGLFKAGKLLFVERRAMWDDTAPGLGAVKIDEFCTKTKTRTLPASD